jgi:hypothetical protein
MKSQIRLGHPAYSGANRVFHAPSKAAAVRELRNRGLTRDRARDAINLVCKRVAGYATVEADFQIIEILHWAGHAEGYAFETTGSGIQQRPLEGE